MLIYSKWSQSLDFFLGDDKVGLCDLAPCGYSSEVIDLLLSPSEDPSKLLCSGR